MKTVKKPTNESDRPTAVTYIAIGQEWTPTRPIQDLPLLIEVWMQMLGMVFGCQIFKHLIKYEIFQKSFLSKRTAEPKC